METNKNYSLSDNIEVKLIDSLGNDLTIVNSARVSFGKKRDVLKKEDIKLLEYLAKHKHYSPFRHVIFQFHIKCPEFVARQMYKHVVGIETTSSYYTKDHAWNEISGRYITLSEIYHPTYWRKQSKDNKQASYGYIEPEISMNCDEIYRKTIDNVMDSYDKLIKMGVCKEQARMLLPLSFMTEFYWTVSFQALENFIELRNDSSAQGEIRELAQKLEDTIKFVAPNAHAVWKS